MVKAIINHPFGNGSIPPIHGNSGDGLLLVMVLLLSGWWF